MRCNAIAVCLDCGGTRYRGQGYILLASFSSVPSQVYQGYYENLMLVYWLCRYPDGRHAMPCVSTYCMACLVQYWTDSCRLLLQELQLTSVRAENNALRNELAAAKKRTADVEERLRAAAAQGRSAQRGANGIVSGFMSNKKARCPAAAIGHMHCSLPLQSWLPSFPCLRHLGCQHTGDHK